MVEGKRFSSPVDHSDTSYCMVSADLEPYGDYFLIKIAYAWDLIDNFYTGGIKLVSDYGNVTNVAISGRYVILTYVPTVDYLHDVDLYVDNEHFSFKINDYSFAALQNLIKSAESDGYISLYHDYTYVIGNDTIKSGIEVMRDLRINGNGHTIDALNQSRIFHVLPTAYVTFDNITFVNGHVESLRGAEGGAIYGDFDAANCIFINNSARYGGAVYIPKEKKALIMDCILQITLHHIRAVLFMY